MPISPVPHHPPNLPATPGQIAQAANQAAQHAVFADYASRKARNTLRRQSADLILFSDFLESLGVPVGDLMADPQAWRAVTWGLVAAFQKWMLGQGYAVATCNHRLSTLKVYAALAAAAGCLDTSELALIQLVHGYSQREAKRVDERRVEEGMDIRKGPKKAAAVRLTREQARQLKDQPDTPQGRRDAVLMGLLLDHGLRCGEVALLRVENFNLKSAEMHFYRPKVNRAQTHHLSPDCLRALTAYFSADQFMAAGALLLGSLKSGKLKGGMSERAITKRVAVLGEAIGVPGLSAHDCRHYWATQAARHHTPLDRLQDAGGWSSLAMPARYIEAAKIANEGVHLGEEGEHPR